MKSHIIWDGILFLLRIESYVLRNKNVLVRTVTKRNIYERIYQFRSERLTGKKRDDMMHLS